jgi:hypothetical protein
MACGHVRALLGQPAAGQLQGVSVAGAELLVRPGWQRRALFAEVGVVSCLMMQGRITAGLLSDCSQVVVI